MTNVFNIVRNIVLYKHKEIMKTLSKSNGLKKLLKVNGGNSKSAKAFQIVSELLGGDQKTYAINGNVIRPCYTSEIGRAHV